jgi:curved DNA-binding protein CbpA
MKMQKSLTSYDILNIPETATQNDIHAAYRALAKRWHPDAHQGGNRIRANHHFQLLEAAYKNIKTPQARSDYNHKLARLRRAVRISQNKAMNDNSKLQSFMNALDSLFQFDGRKGA